MLLESKSSFFTRVSGSIFSPEKTPGDEKSQSLCTRNIKQESVQSPPGSIHLKPLKPNTIQTGAGCMLQQQVQVPLLSRQG